jgi:hypothetical protein
MLAFNTRLLSRCLSSREFNDVFVETVHPLREMPSLKDCNGHLCFYLRRLESSNGILQRCIRVETLSEARALTARARWTKDKTARKKHRQKENDECYSKKARAPSDSSGKNSILFFSLFRKIH